MLHGVSKYGPSNDEQQGPPEPATYYARYRKLSPKLMTLHMFTGLKIGNRPRYVPVYRQNSRGKLLKLREIRPRQ